MTGAAATAKTSRVLAGLRYDIVLMDCIADEFVPPSKRVWSDTRREQTEGGSSNPPRAGGKGDAGVAPT